MSEPTIRRHFVHVGGRVVHYRRAGSGPPVVMLHPSPSHSAGLTPFIRGFAKHFSAIALDTPGYGLSDLLDHPKPEIPDFAEALAETLDALLIETCALFGSHTGASIAIEFVRRYPDRVSVAVFDGYPGYTDEYRADMQQYYLPPYEPKWDGSHLLNTWHKFREQFIFSPTFRHHRENRADAAPWSAERTQDGILPRFMTGEDYNIGYSSVFRYDGLGAAKGLKARTCFAAREGDSLIKALPLLRDGLSDCCWTEVMPRDIKGAVEGYLSILRKYPAPREAPRAPDPEPLPGRITRRYVDVGGTQLMVRELGRGTVPLVMVPHIPGSSDLLEPLMSALAATSANTGGRVLAFDPPGNGDSDDTEDAPSIPAYAEALRGLCESLGLGEIALYGRNAGASVAAAFAKAHAGRVTKLILDGPMALPDDVRAAVAPRYAEPIAPRWDGAHLIHLWFALRNEQLFWPWYDERVETKRDVEPEIDPRHLTRKLVGLLKHYRNYDSVYRAAFDFVPPAPAVPALVCAAPNDVFRQFGEAAARSIPGATWAELPSDIGAAARRLNAFIDA